MFARLNNKYDTDSLVDTKHGKHKQEQFKHPSPSKIKQSQQHTYDTQMSETTMSLTQPNKMKKPD